MSGQAERADLLSAARSLELQLLPDNSLQNPHPVHQVLLPFAYPPWGSQAEVLLEGTSTLALDPLSTFPVWQTQGLMIYQGLGCSAGFSRMKRQKSFVSQGKTIRNNFLANNIHYFDSCASFSRNSGYIQLIKQTRAYAANISIRRAACFRYTAHDFSETTCHHGGLISQIQRATKWISGRK